MTDAGQAGRVALVAGLCAFLAGDGAAAISGQAINVSGVHEVH
jgi:hypothetical protein